ncbi:MAG: hypothetical protein ACR2IE_17640 [Candidatus Sumerlaeaceae bacterium]
MEMTFTTQLPPDPALYDAPATTTKECTIYCSPLLLRWQAPSAGVTTTTGLIVVCPGGNPINDCSRPAQYGDPAWPDTKNVVMCSVFYRNQAFSAPYDFGKLQMGDTLRGIGRLLEIYPQLDRRRLYLFGASTGGHVSLQLLQSARHLWAEVHVHCAPTLITTRAEAQAKYPADSFGDGLNDALKFPEQQGTLSLDQWNRFQAERALRGPQNSMKFDLPARSNGEYPYVWAMYGTLDQIVDIQHYRDLLAIVKSGTGTSGAQATVVGGERWQMRNWTLYTVEGGYHDYVGANANISSYMKATNYRIPDAFSRLRPTAPLLSVDYAFPIQFGWRFHVQGALTSATVTTEGPFTAADTDWMHPELE